MGDIYGESGLDGPALPEPAVDVVAEPAVDLLRRTLLEHPEPVTLVPIGPLTNIATLLDRHPEVREHVAEPTATTACSDCRVRRCTTRSRWRGS